MLLQWRCVALCCRYLLSKAVGHEITRVFSEHHPIYVVRCLVSGFVEPTVLADTEPPGLRQLTTTYSDAALGVEAALAVPLSTLAALPTRCESFFMMAPGSAHAGELDFNPYRNRKKSYFGPRCLPRGPSPHGARLGAAQRPRGPRHDQQQTVTHATCYFG